jgi:hypothetical protein
VISPAFHKSQTLHNQIRQRLKSGNGAGRIINSIVNGCVSSINKILNQPVRRLVDGITKILNRSVNDPGIGINSIVNEPLRECVNTTDANDRRKGRKKPLFSLIQQLLHLHRKVPLLINHLAQDEAKGFDYPLIVLFTPSPLMSDIIIFLRLVSGIIPHR